MSVRLTSQGLQGDYGIPVYTIYFNGTGITGTNYPIGSLIQFYAGSTMDGVPLTGKWNGFSVSSTPNVYPGVSVINLGYRPVLLQRIS